MCRGTYEFFKLSTEGDCMAKDKQKKAKESTKTELKENKKEHKKIKKKEAKSNLEAKTTKGSGKVRFINSIKAKLLLAILVPVCFIVFLGVTSYTKAANSLNSSYKDSSETSISMTSEYLYFIVNTVRAEYNQYINNSEIDDYVNGKLEGMIMEKRRYETYQAEFRTNISGTSFLTGVHVLADKAPSIFTPIGNNYDDDIATYSEVASSTAGQLADSDNSRYFLVGKLESVDEKSGVLATDYSFRMIRRMPSSEGYLIVDLDNELVLDLLTKLEAGEGSYAALITEDGYEITSTEVEKTIFADKSFYQDFLSSEEEIITKDVEFEGASYIFVASKIKGTTACVATLVPQTTVTAKAIEIKNTTILVVIIAVIFASLIGLIVSTGISSAISHMLKQTKKVAEGDLTVTVATKKKDEFHILANGLSGMIAHTKHLIAKVEGISGNLVDSVEAVTNSATVIYEASDHIHGAAGEIEAGVNQQADESVSCLDQMDSLSHKLEKLNQNTKIINEIVHVTAGAVGDGVYNMDSLNEKTKSTTSITKNVIETIQLLEVKSRSIGAIVNAIDDIAEQTNLLSLNASIEAARAGAAGKGFVVVADEIRKLAEQSSVSANKIEEIIDEIVDSTSKAVKIAMEAQEIVHEQEVAVSSTTSSFENIDNQIKKLSHALEDILASVQEIDSARVQTLAAIENISAVSEENASASTTVNDAAAKQLDMVVQLEETAKVLSEHAKELEESIKQFKVR